MTLDEAHSGYSPDGNFRIAGGRDTGVTTLKLEFVVFVTEISSGVLLIPVVL